MCATYAAIYRTNLNLNPYLCFTFHAYTHSISPWVALHCHVNGCSRSRAMMIWLKS